MSRFPLVMVVAVALAFFAWHAGESTRPADAQSSLAARGRFLVAYGGCNDCHTPGYGETGGHVPESKWLVGSNVGFRGPWGTTYPANLRLLISQMTADEWIAMAHTGKMRPPMPSWALQMLSDTDLRAIYAFIQSLGAAGSPAPAYVPPGVTPKTPTIYFVPVPPQQ